MTIWIIAGVLAAFGLLSVLWVLFGFLLPKQRGAAVVCLCRGDGEEEVLIRRYGWLRDLGLIRCPMLLVDCGLSEEDGLRLLKGRPGVEICTEAELPARLEREREKLG